MREIVFDTETTGLSFSGGDRLVEIGCIELVNRVPTGNSFHAYLNPDRPMAAEAFAVHGLSDAFLADKGRFADHVNELLAFLEDSPLIAHNASFDFGFLNGELKLCGRAAVDLDRMVDTLAIARARLPGAKHSLDALCSRFGVDRSHRVLHGALLDAQLLAQVYVELMGGRQIGFALVQDEAVSAPASNAPAAVPTIARAPRQFAPSVEEAARHAEFLTTITEPLWTTEPR